MTPHDPTLRALDALGWELIARYLSDKATPDEVVRVRQWLGNDVGRHRELEWLRTMYERAETPDRAAPADLDRAWQMTARRMRRPPPLDDASPVLSRFVRVAAIVIAAIGGILATDRLFHQGRAQPFREFMSARGSRTTVTLRDGSRLVLGPASRLEVPSDFGVRMRTVTLEGEALFTVVHDAAHPFAVQIGRAVARDVGTTFAVRAYADDADERVAVTEGEVAIGDQSVRAHEVATIDRRGVVSVRRGVDAAPDLAWTQGRLAFNAALLRDVARELSRTFDLDVEVADSSVANQRITAAFANESVDDVLAAVAYLAGAHYDRSGRVIVIRQGSGPARTRTPSGQTLSRIARSKEDR